MRLVRLLAAGVATLLLSLPLTASAQNAAPPIPLSQDQLDGLLAPIALYPDQLLTQVLIASTYPLEVVEAARFVKANPTLKGQALEDALRDKTWDASVLSLAAFPQVLDMMDAHLEWTQRLGDAFLADEAAVMGTVQSLRQRAEQAGNLRSTEQQTVVVQDRNIIIEPAQPEYVYVPVYNPTVIYGPWWAPDYRPWYWYPPPIWGYAPAPSWWGYTAGFSWGTRWSIGYNNWGWARPNWYNRSVNINVGNNYWLNRPQYRERYPGGGGNWSHAPEHRRGVAYRDPGTSNRYRPTNPGAIQSRESYRGRDQSGRDQMPGTRPVPGSPGQPGTGQATPPTTDRSATRPMPGSPGQGGTRPGAPPTTERPTTRPMPSAPSGQPATPATAPTTTERPMTRPTPGYPGQPGTQPTPIAPSGQPPARVAAPPGSERSVAAPKPSQPSGQPVMRPMPSQPSGQPAMRPMPSQPAGQPVMRPAPSQPATPSAPTFQTQPRPQVQMESTRGQMSRQTMSTPTAPAGRSAAPADPAALPKQR